MISPPTRFETQTASPRRGSGHSVRSSEPVKTPAPKQPQSSPTHLSPAPNTSGTRSGSVTAKGPMKSTPGTVARNRSAPHPPRARDVADTVGQVAQPAAAAGRGSRRAHPGEDRRRERQQRDLGREGR